MRSDAPTLYGGGIFRSSRFYHIPFEVTTKEWCQILVAEVTHSGQAQKRHEAVLAKINILQGESWMIAARRLVIHVRAATTGEASPYTPEEVYVWRYVSGGKWRSSASEQSTSFFTNGPDRNGMEFPVIQVGTDANITSRPYTWKPADL